MTLKMGCYIEDNTSVETFHRYKLKDNIFRPILPQCPSANDITKIGKIIIPRCFFDKLIPENPDMYKLTLCFPSGLLTTFYMMVRKK